MDNLGKAAEYLEKVTSEMDGRTIVLKARVPIMALRLAVAGVLALVDMAVSLRCVTEHLGYEEGVDAANKT